jgi:hypothetical protein
MDYADWGRVLAERFPTDRMSEAELARNEAEWAALKLRLPTGQQATGVVIAKAPFDAWIDIGVGFPALLEIVCIAGMDPERYRADDWCPIGSEVTAFVGSFNDRRHQIGLYQVLRGGLASI